MEPLNTMVNGSISLAGYYQDCIPTMVISIKKSDAHGVPYKEGEIVPVSLVVGSITYNARLRSGPNTPHIKISAELINKSGESVRLADVLLGQGFRLKEKVKMNIQGTTLFIVPAHE